MSDDSHDQRYIPTPKQLEQYAFQFPVEIIAEWLQNPEYAHIQNTSHRKAKDVQGITQRLGVLKRLLRWCRKSVYTQQADFHGSGLVLEEQVKDSEKVAQWCNFANGWNTLTLAPLLQFMFSNLPLGPLVASGFTLAFLKTSNTASAGFAQNNPRTHLSSCLWGVAVLGLNIIGTVSSGPGILMLLDRGTLDTIHAQHLIKTHVLQPLEVQLSPAGQQEIQSLQQKCDAARDEMSRLPHGHPRRVDLYNTFEGPHGTPPEFWETVPNERLPRCLLAQRLQTQNREAISKVQATLDATRQTISDQGEIPYLRDNRAALFQLHFNDDEQIKSGPKIVELALTSFVQQWESGSWAALGIQALSFSISLVTSVMALALILAHALRPDTVNTHNQGVSKTRNKMFENLHRGIDNL